MPAAAYDAGAGRSSIARAVQTPKVSTGFLAQHVEWSGYGALPCASGPWSESRGGDELGRRSGAAKDGHAEGGEGSAAEGSRRYVCTHEGDDCTVEDVVQSEWQSGYWQVKSDSIELLWQEVDVMEYYMHG